MNHFQEKLGYLQGWTFHKLELRVSKGASGQIRIMYLVNEETRVILPTWIYSHEQFMKRPSDQEIDGVIKEIFGEDIDGNLV